MPPTYLVTGGAGFIGSNFARLVRAREAARVVNLDKMTYAGHPANLQGLDADPGHDLVVGDIGDRKLVAGLLREHQVDAVVNFAAETHVDRSILGPEEFVETNVAATFRLLDESLAYWRELPGARREAFRFLHVSTDEVYGHLEADDPAFTEETPYAPRSPYSASKASSDHLARSFFHTYDLPLVITNCSNNYGPRQFPEKLIPLCLLNALEGKPLPVYGRGENVRDWLFVDDHCEAILAVLHRGRPGRSYNVGGECEMTNIDLVRRLCRVLDAKLPDSPHTPHENLITFVADRPGHDLRYAMNISRIRDELGWTPGETFETGLAKTVDWYLDHGEWVESIRSGDYARWIEANYRGRGPRSDKDET